MELVGVTSRVLKLGTKPRIWPQCILGLEHLAAILCNLLQYLGYVLNGYRKAGTDDRRDELAIQTATDVACLENYKGVTEICLWAICLPTWWFGEETDAQQCQYYTRFTGCDKL
jgi:hypothetical protein